MSEQLLQTYLYKGKEVKLTGRSAERKTKRNIEIEFYEIKPLDADDEDNRHNQWVKMADLMIIKRKEN